MKYTPEKIVNGNSQNYTSFTIPLYQRLFEWDEDNVMQLLNDLYKSYKDDKNSDYYIGMLTATQSVPAHHLIDGQQRFTVMMLFGCCMQEYYPEGWQKFLLYDGHPRLKFISRHSDDMYIQKLIEKDFDYNGELQNIKMKQAILTIREFFENKSKSIDFDPVDFSKYVFYHLSFFISELPKVYSPQDFNKYFERMNSTGKNLEHHEILKVKLLMKLIEEGVDISLCMQVWNRLADMDSLFLYKKENESEEDFKSRKVFLMTKPLNEILNSIHLVNRIKTDKPNIQNTIRNISASSKKPQEISYVDNGSRSVLNFSQLLLNVLFYYLKKEGVDVISKENFFNQNNLLDTFKKYLPYEGKNVDPYKIAKFFELLIHCRVVLDVCFIRTLQYGYSLDMNSRDENKNLKQLLMFESMLYVSSTYQTHYRWFNWVMDAVFDNQAVISSNELYKSLKSKCDSTFKLPKLDELNYKGNNRFWFWYLDFYIWQNRNELFAGDENEEYRQVADNYVFIRNRSLEHIAPQTPKSNSDMIWEDDENEIMNSFGNLVMISQGLNSALQNESFEVKREHVRSYCKGSKTGSIESLKLLMVYKDYRDQKWNRDTIKKHGDKMYELLEKAIEKEKYN